MTISLASLPTDFRLKAYTNPNVVGSVRFTVNGVFIKHENDAPYVLEGAGATTNYMTWFTVGTHTLLVTPYTNGSGFGTAGTSFTMTFTVVP